MYKSKQLLLLFPVLLFTFLVSAGESLALTYYPTADFNVGSFAYDQSVNGTKIGNGPSATYENRLTLTSITISRVMYGDGTYSYSDPIVGATINIGGYLYSRTNSSVSGNPFTNLGGGSGIFSITEGGNTYLTGALNPNEAFTPVGTGFASAIFGVWGIDTSMDTSGSRWVSEALGDGFRFNLTLTFNSGPNTFLSDAYGLGQGKFIAPEPSSLILIGSGVVGILLLRRKKS